MEITEEVACRVSFAEHDRDRSLFQKEFVRRLLAEPGLDGRVLDIGCGPDLPSALEPLRTRLMNLDGVDVIDEIQNHPQLKNHWKSPMESAPVPESAYDLAYAYNVVEHITDAEPFLRAVRRTLKPGGAFWALTPQGHHPFCRCVRLVENLSLKKYIAKRDAGVNDYPAFYRLNRVKDIAQAATAAGFTRLQAIYLPCVQWDRYFPRWVRFVPHIHDRVLGLRRPRSMLVLAYKLA